MKRDILLLLAAGAVALMVPSTGAVFAAGQLAIPDAQGFGAYATGGRGGTVQVVTNLNSSGPGSFADAVSQANSIVVFDVGGVVDLTSELAIASNVTIFGQTAPGQGIALEGGSSGYNISLSGSSNDIIQYIRVLQGGPSTVQKTAIEMYNTSNAILDHVSVEYAPYDSIDMTGSGSNITIQNSLLADPIMGQQFNVHAQDTGPDSFFNNIFANSDNRNPMAKVDDQFINNVDYNFRAGYTVADTGGDFNQDIIGNYFITGPSTTDNNDAFFQMDSNITAYSAGNLENTGRNGVLNGAGISPSGVTVANTPFYSEAPKTAQQAYSYDVANAGDSLHLNSVDALVLNQVASLGTSGNIYNSPGDTGISNGGMGTIQGGSLPLGGQSGDVPIAWIQQMGLTTADFANPTGDYNNTGYDNIEKYAAAIAGESIQLGNSVYWNGAGGTVWNSAANWSTSATSDVAYNNTPQPLDDVYFTSGANVTLGADQSVHSVNSSSSNAVTIGAAAHTLTVGAGGINTTGAGELTFNSAVELNGGGINASAGGITIGDGLALTNGNYEFTVGNGQTLTLNGTLARNNSTVDFANGGTVAGNSLANAGSTGIIGGWATVNQTDWATVSGGNVQAYSGYLNFTGNNAQISQLTGYSGSSNFRITNDSTGDATLAAGTTDINTLLDADQTTARQVDIGSGNTLRLGAAGGVLQAANGLGLTIGAAGSQAGTITAGGPVDNNAGELILINDSTAAALTVNSQITDNGTGGVTLTTSGPGTTALNAANTYSGPTNIDSGTLYLGNAGALPADGTVNISQGATLDIGGNNVAIASLNGAGTVDNNNPNNTGNYTLTLGGNNANGTFNGAIEDSVGTLALVKNGTGTLTLGGANTFSGGLTLNNGTLNLNNLSGAGIGTLTVNDGSVDMTSAVSALDNNLQLNGGTVNLSNEFMDVNGAINITGSATINTGNNVVYFAGAFSGNGTLNLTSSYVPTFESSFASFTGTVNLGANSMDFRLFGGFYGSSAATFNLGTGKSTLDAGKIYYSDTISLGALDGGAQTAVIGSATAGLTFGYSIGGNNQNSNFAGVIGDGSGSPTFVTKVGSGTLTLSGANTYTGATTVSAGTLLVDGSITSATSVSAGATLGGTGSINAAVSSAGTINPGDGASAGTLAISNLTLQNSGSLDFILNTPNAAAGTLGNSLIATTDATLASGITLNIQAGSGFGAGVYHLMSFSDALNNPTDLNSWTINGPTGYTYTLTDPAGMINLNVTAVPEPAALGLLALGGAAALMLRKRQRPTGK